MFAAGAGASLAAVAVMMYASGDAVQAKQKESSTKADMQYKHVIIGAGVSARSCLKKINELDNTSLPEGYDGKVLMIGNDARMNSIGYSEADRSELESPSNNPENTILLGHEAKNLDISNKQVELHDGTVVEFDKCFIATGGHYPKFKNVMPSAEGHVTTFRRQEDLKDLVEKAAKNEVKHVTVVGGGSLGCEIATHLKEKAPQVQVTQVYAEPGALHRHLPEYMRAYVTALLRAKGIAQRNFSLVTNIEKNQKTGRLHLTIDSWEQDYMDSDHVVFAPTHIDANTDLAENAGLEIDRENSGVIVNSELQAFSDIYVGGDAASYPSKWLGRRRDQTYDHAVESGETAAKNMMGMREVYSYIPSSQSKLPLIGLDTVFVGDCDARYETFGLWELTKQKKKGKTEDQAFFTSKYNKGVTFFLDNGAVVGVLLTNIEDKEDVERARQAIRDRVDYSDLKRSEMEAELRELLGFELQVPMVRTTMSKSGAHKKEARTNAYKLKRTTTESVPRHSTDFIKDSNTNLYWRAH